jgi:hypothetical protein
LTALIAAAIGCYKQYTQATTADRGFLWAIATIFFVGASVGILYRRPVLGGTAPVALVLLLLPIMTLVTAAVQYVLRSW